MSLNYEPPPTLARFMLDDHFVRVAVGPIGSGKSMACIMELLRRARDQAPYEGVRHSRFAIVRNTQAQLRTTVLNDIREYIGPMMSFFVTDSTIKIRAPLSDGTMIDSDWLMIPLDTKEDQQRLLSLQLTGAWINELREVPIEIVNPLLGRLGRYPSAAYGGPTWNGLIADTNPWDEDSPYHDQLVLNPDPKWALFHQPSGIGPDAENIDHLVPGYYERLAGNRDTGWVEVHIQSMWGTSNAGQAVFRKSFHAPDHVRDMNVIVNPHRPLIVGMDFGRTPTALIGQTDNYGRLLIFKEVVTEDMALPQMLDEQLKPVLLGEPFDGRRIFVVADPSGSHKSQVSEETPFDILKEAGFLAYPASTNNIEPRLNAVVQLFTKRIMGESAIQINRLGCPQLVQALGSRYRYKKKRDGNLEDKPEKLHPWSDLADSMQYMALGVKSNLTGRVLRRDQARSRERVPVSAAGWT